MARPLRFEVDGYTERPLCSAPSLSGPTSATISYNGTTTLSVTATNVVGGTISYAWYRGTAPDQSAPVSGANQATLTTPALTETTLYWVRVTKTCGSDSASSNSGTATVTVRLATPTNVIAMPDGNTIRVSWNPVAGATSYTVYRKRGTEGFTPYPSTDNPYVDGGTETFMGYLYRVVANRTNAESSAQSAVDVAVRAPYTTPVVTPNLIIRGVDVSELRRAIDAARVVGGLPAAWSSYAPQTGLIFASHWIELHAKPTEARAQLNATYGIPPTSLGTAPTVNSTIRADYSMTLRGGVE
jgi:hypothetical protein